MSDTRIDAAREEADRRASRRIAAGEACGIVSTRVRAGDEVTLVNISTGGALIETMQRLLPGAPIELQVTTAALRTAVRGRVLRSAVARLHAAQVCYRGAVRFDRPQAWPDAVGEPDVHPRFTSREGPTPHVL
jgi:hypothetical protein